MIATSHYKQSCFKYMKCLLFSDSHTNSLQSWFPLRYLETKQKKPWKEGFSYTSHLCSASNSDQNIFAHKIANESTKAQKTHVVPIFCSPQMWQSIHTSLSLSLLLVTNSKILQEEKNKERHNFHPDV
jgi:hypothetical protein